jgi:hypothetical protein
MSRRAAKTTHSTPVMAENLTNTGHQSGDIVEFKRYIKPETNTV